MYAGMHVGREVVDRHEVRDSHACGLVADKNEHLYIGMHVGREVLRGHEVRDSRACKLLAETHDRCRGAPLQGQCCGG